MIDVRVVTIARNPSSVTTIWTNLPNLRYKFVLSDKGDASWEAPLSHTQMATDVFAPIASDYRIGIKTAEATTWTTAQEGIIGPVGLRSEEQLVNVQGFDYLWWLEQPYRFSGYNVAQSVWTAPDILKFWNLGTQQIDIINDLVANTWTGNALQSLQLIPSFVGSNWSDTTLENIVIGDTTTVLEKIKGLGSYTEPLGFHFTMLPGKVIGFWSPRKNGNIPTTGNIVGSFSPSAGNLLDIDWTNHGPIAVTTVGIPSFGAALTSYKPYTPSKNQYRDWWQIYRPTKDVFHLHTQSTLDAVTDARATLDRNPQKELTITIKPDVANHSTSGVVSFDEKFWFTNQVGEYIWVDSEQWFMPYHRIQAYYVITSQEISGDDAGNWTCKLTLDQVY